MKNKLILFIVFTIFLISCGNDETQQTIENDTFLKISNLSGYDLLNVEFSSTDFDTIIIGRDSKRKVNADTKPVYFYLNIVGINIQCRTNEMVTCEKGIEKELIFTNYSLITVIESGRTDTIKNIFDLLSVEMSNSILVLSIDDIVIENNSITSVDFGVVEVESNKAIVFTIKNTGNIPLVLNGNPIIESSNASFSVISQPLITTINPGANTNFILRYTPSADKEDMGVITIVSNSSNALFIFNIKGTGCVKKPRISIRQGFTTINAHGEYDFGTILINKTSDVTFTIVNSGELDLVITSVNNNRINLENNTEGYFSIIQQPFAPSLAPSNSTSFIIRFSPITIGSNFSATIQIKVNTPENEDFSFILKGNGRNYIVGDRGPASGYIFYDKGLFSNGWRYLEAAPLETEFNAVQWGTFNTDVIGTGVAIGTGKQNTEIILEQLQLLGESGRAAQLCANLNFEGFNDWFLPSKDELNLICNNLITKGLGGFSSDGSYYWSSSQYSNREAYTYRASSPVSIYSHSYSKTYGCKVRAVRAF